MHFSQKVWPQAVKRRGKLLSANYFWHRGQVTSRSIFLITSVIINYRYINSHAEGLAHLNQLYLMRKYAGRSVIYLSKQLTGIDTTQQKFFPFLNSPLIHSQAMSQFTTTGLHALCNITNIKDTIPHKQQFQQFVFFGRSNVGKSTLVNQLIRRDFVQVSKKPGKTKELAFLKIKSTVPTLLVDAPGYGYASDASKHDIMQWGRLIEYYLKNTPSGNNQMIMVLIDAVHGFKDTDGMLIKMLNQMRKNFQIVFTKCDRASQNQLDEAVEIARELQGKFSNMNFYLHLTSYKENFGIAELRNHMLYKMAMRQLEREQSGEKK